MANDSQNLVRIASIFDVPENAGALCNVLRNAGLIVRDTLVQDEQGLETTLTEQPLDLVLAQVGARTLSPDRALKAIARSGRDIPLILVAPSGADGAVVAFLQAGARDAVGATDHERLKHIVDRELGDLRIRRAQRQVEQLLRETEKRARNLIDSSRDAIAYVHDGMHIYANKSYMKMFGYEAEDDIQGVPIMDMVSGEDHGKFKDFLRRYAKGELDNDSTLDVQGMHVDGRSFKITMEFSRASMEGEACTQIIIRDVSSSKELEKKLNFLSKQDLLTGLYNRSYFLEQAEKLFARAMDGHDASALLYVQLDDFAQVKEKLGLSGADLFIADIAKLLKDAVAERGLAARFEGAVFTLLLDAGHAQEAEQFAQKICTQIAEHISEVGGQSARTTASIGISLINETAGNSQQVLLNAEKACEAASSAGGNRFHLHTPAMEDLSEKELLVHWSQRIRDALQRNQFQLLFQPIVSLRGEPGENYELLVRMLDEDGGEVQAKDFVPVAEKTGLMQYIDRWVIANAFKVLAERSAQGKVTRFHIKLSAASLIDPNTLPWISERIKALRLDADRLVFEVSEQTALNYLSQAKVVVEGLKGLRCRFTLGHFGIESNLFGSLKHLNVDYVKIDGSLVQDISRNPELQDKVKEIAETARKLGKLTLASLVEDANSMAVLWQCSVDFIQGYFLAPPEEEMTYDFSEQN